jgi:iron-sulfur cluster repair protein YtfE (RIC family)
MTLTEDHISVTNAVDWQAPIDRRWIDAWTPASDLFHLVTVDLYRDIHKGIRSELFAIVGRAGSVDPNHRSDVLDLVAHVSDVHALLEAHAHHEDATIQPVLERELPDLAERIERDHLQLDRTIGRIADIAATLDVGATSARRDTHRLYLDLGRFTSEYLVHIDIEERVLMPALEDAIGTDAAFELNATIVGSIEPADMVTSLALMLPAMNVEDRVDLLGGMRAGAPADVFGGVVDLAGSVLRTDDFRSLQLRLGLS